MKDDLHHQIWESALRKLSIRPHSQHELKIKLLRDFPHEEEAIGTALDEMVRVHLLNDRQFTEAYVRSLIQKPIGRIKIMVEARQRRLDPLLVDQFLLDFGWDEGESCQRAAAEKERSLQRENDPRKRKQKLMAFLRSRGFTDRTIWKGLSGKD